MILSLIEDVLAGEGHEVSTVRRLDEATALAKGMSFDAALLDINVIGGRSYPVAHILNEKGAPFIFVTGFYPDQVDMPDEFRTARMLMKPCRMTDLVAAVRSMISSPGINARPAHAS